MKILLATVGTTGDVLPFVGLGRALQARGHAVILATNGHFAGLAELAGLEFLSLSPPEAYQAAVADPDLFQREFQGFKVFARQLILPGVRPLFEAIRERHDREPLVVAATGLSFGARIAQEVLGVPLATIHLQPTLLRGVGDLPSLPGWIPRPWLTAMLPLADRLMDRTLAAPLNSLRAEHGLKPTRGIMGRWWHSPQRVIGLFPPWYGPPQPDWPPETRLTGFPLYDASQGAGLEDDVREFLDAGEAPVVFTPGTAMAHAHSFFRVSTEACARIGRRGVFLTRFPDQLPQTLPPGVRHFPYVPLSELLPRAAAVVHHGGIGTLSQCLAAGVPQLVMPLSFDQPDGAARVRRLGVGLSLFPRAYRTGAVSRALTELAGSAAIRTATREIAGRFGGSDPLEDTCRLIEELG